MTIIKKIYQRRVDYLLALKANQENFLEDVRFYFSDSEFLQKCSYKRTIEKAKGKTEKREYQQTDISWLSQKKE
ncbi:MAG: hypothetical protein HFG39_08180 [Lachnospiraceae bacterium]|nr:hypothetical protein [Lachnospiraceae bacterium]